MSLLFLLARPSEGAVDVEGIYLIDDNGVYLVDDNDVYLVNEEDPPQ